jgi:hypothetical protein
MQHFIPCEDGSYVYVPNITRLSLSTDYSDKSQIKAHTIGPGMPFTVASFETSRDAASWLADLVDRIEHGTPHRAEYHKSEYNPDEGVETR